MVSQALASTLDEEELSDLKDQFHAIDIDKSGAISLEEMRQVSHFKFVFLIVEWVKIFQEKESFVAFV